MLEDYLAGVRCALSHLGLDTCNAVAGGICWHHEGANPALARGGVGDREDNREVCILARGDELLCAIKDIAIVLPFGTRFEPRGIAASLRRGKTERGQFFAAGEGR